MPKSSLRHLLVPLVASSIFACNAEPMVDVEQEHAVVSERQADFFRALSAEDAEQLSSYFAEDAVLHIANRPAIVGREAIQQFYGNVFRFMESSETVAETLRVSSGGDLAYSLGSSENGFEGPEGGIMFAGKYSLVWEKRAGTWMAVTYSLSNDSADGTPTGSSD